MFGISITELIIVLIVALLFIRPADLPEIAYFIGRFIYKGKKLYMDAKNYLKISGRDFGLDEVKYELDRGIADEKAKLDDDITVIVDMDGNEHKVNLKHLDREVDESEIEELNSNNKPL
ncbi:MAG: twin-arginine translocase TatA/TatE family subunit [Rickettsiales bacterium]|nr:twin-arginine translocase TatA/TatE family subunit [Rickettsiales bacterium]